MGSCAVHPLAAAMMLKVAVHVKTSRMLHLLFSGLFFSCWLFTGLNGVVVFLLLFSRASSSAQSLMTFTQWPNFFLSPLWTFFSLPMATYASCRSSASSSASASSSELSLTTSIPCSWSVLSSSSSSTSVDGASDPSSSSAAGIILTPRSFSRSSSHSSSGCVVSSWLSLLLLSSCSVLASPSPSWAMKESV